MDLQPSQFHFVRIEDVVTLVDVMGIGPIRDVGLIESALHRPRSSAFGIEVYVDIFDKAAVLLDSLVRNHGLVDGNKRMAWTCTFMFLRMNGIVLGGELRENLEFMLACARGDLEVAEMTDWLKAHSERIEGA